MQRRADLLVRAKPLQNRVEAWREFLRVPDDGEVSEQLRLHERTGRPLGSLTFIEELERLSGRLLHRRKPGPSKRERKR